MIDEPQPRRARALDHPEAKIWRYTDLARFVSMLSSKTLYFARPSQFHDPFEGWMPRSHIEAVAGINQKYIDNLNETRAQFHDINPNADLKHFDENVDRTLKRYAEQARAAITQSCERFGISCWHKSEYESEAMWRAYPSDSLAIESTVGQLHEAYRGEGTMQVYGVRYADFDRDPIEKGHEQYLLVMKRKSFEHEREVRALLLLGNGDAGAPIPYDIDTLINRVVISPFAGATFGNAVKATMKGSAKLDKPLVKSALYEKPHYGIQLDLKPRADPTQ